MGYLQSIKVCLMLIKKEFSKESVGIYSWLWPGYVCLGVGISFVFISLKGG